MGCSPKYSFIILLYLMLIACFLQLNRSDSDSSVKYRRGPFQRSAIERRSLRFKKVMSCRHGDALCHDTDVCVCACDCVDTKIPSLCKRSTGSTFVIAFLNKSIRIQGIVVTNRSANVGITNFKNKTHRYMNSLVTRTYLSVL